jgi:hypothetical protein
MAVAKTPVKPIPRRRKQVRGPQPIYPLPAGIKRKVAVPKREPYKFDLVFDSPDTEQEAQEAARKPKPSKKAEVAAILPTKAKAASSAGPSNLGRTLAGGGRSTTIGDWPSWPAGATRPKPTSKKYPN